jgi:hypothetical protein
MGAKIPFTAMGLLVKAIKRNPDGISWSSKTAAGGFLASQAAQSSGFGEAFQRDSTHNFKAVDDLMIDQLDISIRPVH